MVGTLPPSAFPLAAFEIKANQSGLSSRGTIDIYLKNELAVLALTIRRPVSFEGTSVGLKTKSVKMTSPGSSTRHLSRFDTPIHHTSRAFKAHPVKPLWALVAFTVGPQRTFKCRKGVKNESICTFDRVRDPFQNISGPRSLHPS